MVVFSKVKSIPWLGDGGSVHFFQLVGALAGNLDNTVRTFLVRHELMLFTLEEDFPEDKLIWHKGTCPDVLVEAPDNFLLISSKLDSGRFSVLFGQIFISS